MTRLEAVEMRFLRSVKGYTRLDKIRSVVIRKELEISGIQDVRSKHKTASAIYCFLLLLPRALLYLYIVHSPTNVLFMKLAKV